MQDALIWQDGKTAIDHAVSNVSIAGYALVITGAAGSVSWPVNDITVQDTPPATLIVACKNQPGRLIASGEGAAQIRATLQASGAWRRTNNSRRGKLAFGITAVLAASIGLWFGWPSVADRLVNIVPTRADVSIGEALQPLLIGTERQCASPAGSAALAQVLTRLEPFTPTPLPLRVVVIDSDTINALAMPGGTIIVYRGLLDNAQSPDEVAGVLAHEIGHQSYRHSMRGLMRHAGIALVISTLDPSGGLLGSIATHLTQTAHTRSFEVQADEYAVEALQRAQISTKGLLEFFTRLHEAHGDATGLWRYAQTHPPLADRIARIPETSGTRLLDSDGWKALRNICRSTATQKPTTPN